MTVRRSRGEKLRNTTHNISKLRVKSLSSYRVSTRIRRCTYNIPPAYVLCVGTSIYGSRHSYILYSAATLQIINVSARLRRVVDWYRFGDVLKSNRRSNADWRVEGDRIWRFIRRRRFYWNFEKNPYANQNILAVSAANSVFDLLQDELYILFKRNRPEGALPPPPPYPPFKSFLNIIYYYITIHNIMIFNPLSYILFYYLHLIYYNYNL